MNKQERQKIVGVLALRLDDLELDVRLSDMLRRMGVFQVLHLVTLQKAVLARNDQFTDRHERLLEELFRELEEQNKLSEGRLRIGMRVPHSWRTEISQM